MVYIYQNFQKFRTSLHHLTLIFILLLLLLLLFRVALFLMLGGFSTTGSNVFELIPKGVFFRFSMPTIALAGSLKELKKVRLGKTPLLP